jgi:hypothetical protein
MFMAKTIYFSGLTFSKVKQQKCQYPTRLTHIYLPVYTGQPRFFTNFLNYNVVMQLSVPQDEQNARTPLVNFFLLHFFPD